MISNFFSSLLVTQSTEFTEQMLHYLAAHLTFEHNRYLALHCIYEALREPALTSPVIFEQVRNILQQMPPDYRRGEKKDFTHYLLQRGYVLNALRV